MFFDHRDTLNIVHLIMLYYRSATNNAKRYFMKDLNKCFFRECGVLIFDLQCGVKRKEAVPIEKNLPIQVQSTDMMYFHK